MAAHRRGIQGYGRVALEEAEVGLNRGRVCRVGLDRRGRIGISLGDEEGRGEDDAVNNWRRRWLLVKEEWVERRVMVLEEANHVDRAARLRPTYYSSEQRGVASANGASSLQGAS
jgi:hypothetical protein